VSDTYEDGWADGYHKGYEDGRHVRRPRRRELEADLMEALTLVRRTAETNLGLETALAIAITELERLQAENAELRFRLDSLDK
jgi:hypothetical protein